MFLISSCSHLCPIHGSHMLSLEWRCTCSWSSADRQCSNYFWVVNNFIAYYGASYITGLMVPRVGQPVGSHKSYQVILSERFLPSVPGPRWLISSWQAGRARVGCWLTASSPYQPVGVPRWPRVASVTPAWPWHGVRPSPRLGGAVFGGVD